MIRVIAAEQRRAPSLTRASRPAASCRRCGPVLPVCSMDERARLNLEWLLRLRWGAAGGKLLVIVIARVALGLALPLAWLLVLVSVELVSNAAATMWHRRSRKRAHLGESPIVALMAMDVLLLSLMLHLSGGPSNPFSFLYVMYIALGAVVLRARFAWGLAALALACFGAQFYWHRPLPGIGHAHHTMQLHLRGMWVAFGMGSLFIVYFVQRIARALARRDAELAEARERGRRAEQLASLGTLAAGAAHELSTPLSTIAVIAKELQHDCDAQQVASDARAIREQVDRCRKILDRMSADAGQSSGESFGPATVAAIVAEATCELEAEATERVSLDDQSEGRVLYVPKRAVAQALRALINNALDASPPSAPIALAARCSAEECALTLTDRGCGMTAADLARAGEPFFTTKDPGRGMGLGLFLARTVVQRLGGRLDLASSAGCGTRATLALPLAGADAARSSEALHG